MSWATFSTARALAKTKFANDVFGIATLAQRQSTPLPKAQSQAEAMLLLFHVGEGLYAIDTDRVIEIVPMVLLRKIEPAPDHIAGVFNYRGNIVPVIDLCRLIRGNPCRVCYSSRVIMVNYSPGEEQSQRQFGLIVERVSETLKLSADRIKTAESISNSPYFGELFVDEKGIIQKVNWEQLIKDADQAALLDKGNRQANGAGRN